jgi:stage III sporulation protein AD
MDIFLKITAGVLVSLIVCLVLAKQNKDIGTLVSIGVCCMVAVVALTYFQPVVEFLGKLQQMTGVDTNIFRILTKAVGIALVGEIASMVCADAGHGAMGKVMQILASFTVLWLSLPLFTQLIELIENVLSNQ